jgi:hypothetical protein
VTAANPSGALTDLGPDAAFERRVTLRAVTVTCPFWDCCWVRDILHFQMGKAVFDAVGPMLLIGWAEVGPGLLQAIGGAPAAERTALMPHPIGHHPVGTAPSKQTL